MMSERGRRWAVAAGLALLLAGCDYLPFGQTTVLEITTAPASFEGKEVKVAGRATSVVQLLGMKAFILRDDTGDITVLTRGELPVANAEVMLKGTVHSAAIIGGQSIGLRIDETKRIR